MKELLNFQKYAFLTKGSKFYEKQQRRRIETDEKIAAIINKKNQLSAKDVNFAKTITDKLIFDLEKSRNTSRNFIHIDMDGAFF
jgi:hypothetical protein